MRTTLAVSCLVMAAASAVSAGTDVQLSVGGLLSIRAADAMRPSARSFQGAGQSTTATSLVYAVAGERRCAAARNRSVNCGTS